VQIKLTDPEAEWLTTIAARTGVSTADLIRRAVETYLSVVAADEQADDLDWQALSLSALEAEWDNPEDAIYDSLRALFPPEANP
jgi:hypothetical protein